MGRPPSSPSDQPPTTTHFSHPHPLHLSTNPPPTPCSACKHHPFGPAYACTPCNFLLHPKCHQLPQQITHPSHTPHTLILHPKPVYPEGVFNCDACGNKGDGFSYRCDPCGVDLHTTCAMLTLEFSHQCHQHKLSLTFVAPYAGNSFSCDICKRVGSKTWIYRCHVCEFDVHLTCVVNVVPVEYSNLNQPGYGNGGVRPGDGGLVGQVAGGVAEGVASAVAQTAAQALIQGVFGGGGGGGGGAGVVIVDGGAYAEGGYGGSVEGEHGGGGGSY